MTKITYSDKSYLHENVSIPEVNKVTDTNMNEIKSVVNDNYDEMQNELYYNTGDVIELGGATASTEYVLLGFITSGTTSLFLTIITPKRLDNISSISVNNLQVEARGISGYLNSQSGFIEYVGLSGYTITADKVSPNAITLRITKSSAFTNVTNNTPIELNGYFKLTLS